jgi:hypothetical protein
MTSMRLINLILVSCGAFAEAFVFTPSPLSGVIHQNAKSHQLHHITQFSTVQRTRKSSLRMASQVSVYVYILCVFLYLSVLLILFDLMKSCFVVFKGMYPIIGEESIMSKKAHGTSATPVQKDLRWNCDANTADRICNYNRHFAEFAGCVYIF